MSATTEGACSELDWQVLRSIANDANDYLTAAERDNKLDTQYGTTGTRGGNWDLSTRLATACEAMVLPFRLEYRFACDSATSTIGADVRCPPPTCFRSRAGAAPLVSGSMHCPAPRRRGRYALRLAALIAAAAFGTSVGVTRVVVNGREGSIAGATVMSLEFGRIPSPWAPWRKSAAAVLRAGHRMRPGNAVRYAAPDSHRRQYRRRRATCSPSSRWPWELSVPYTPVAEDTSLAGRFAACCTPTS